MFDLTVDQMIAAVIIIIVFAVVAMFFFGGFTQMAHYASVIKGILGFFS